MQIKHPIDPARLRKAPSRGFGWIDHRFLREGHIDRASVEALALYLLLACAADAQGLSFYSDGRIAQLLGLQAADVARARRELIRLDLILYRRPIYQLLSLEEAACVARPREGSLRQGSGTDSSLRSPEAAPGEGTQTIEDGHINWRAAVEALLKNQRETP